MYIVQNQTSTTIILSDIRVEIGPRKVIDLEMVVPRSSIENSLDLQYALAHNKLALTRHSIIRTDHVATKPEKSNEDHDARIAKIVRDVVTEELQKHPIGKNDNSVEHIQKTLGNFISEIRTQINNVNVGGPKQEEFSIDPKKLAEASQKSLEKLSNEIESNSPKKPKSINVINDKKLTDLANELG